MRTKTIILFAIIVSIAIAQRGGGGGGGRLSFRSSSTGGSGGEIGWLIGVGSVSAIVAAGAGIKYYYDHQDNSQNRQQDIQNLMDSHQRTIQENESFWTNDEKNAVLNSFRDRKWKMQFDVGNRIGNICQIKILKVELKTPSIYDIQIIGIDFVGQSQFKGLLTFGSRAELFLSKTYSNRDAAGQTGSFQILIYEGQNQGNIFVGRWYYKGHEGSSEYSGSWRLTYQ